MVKRANFLKVILATVISLAAFSRITHSDDAATGNKNSPDTTSTRSFKSTRIKPTKIKPRSVTQGSFRGTGKGWKPGGVSQSGFTPVSAGSGMSRSNLKSALDLPPIPFPAGGKFTFDVGKSSPSAAGSSGGSNKPASQPSHLAAPATTPAKRSLAPSEGKEPISLTSKSPYSDPGNPTISLPKSTPVIGPQSSRIPGALQQGGLSVGQQDNALTGKGSGGSPSIGGGGGGGGGQPHQACVIHQAGISCTAQNILNQAQPCCQKYNPTCCNINQNSLCDSVPADNIGPGIEIWCD